MWMLVVVSLCLIWREGRGRRDEQGLVYEVVIVILGIVLVLQQFGGFIVDQIDILEGVSGCCFCLVISVVFFEIFFG